MKIVVVDIDGTPHEIKQGIQPNFDVLARWSGCRFLVLASNNGDLFNPLDINNQIKKRDKERGGLFWKLRTCSPECYRNYTVFLRSKNMTPYLLAQRRFNSDI